MSANWYNRINNIPASSQNRYQENISRNNPMQYVMNAMRDPVSFVSEQFPDVPENIRNNPNAVLNYLANTRGHRFVQMFQQLSGMRGGR